MVREHRKYPKKQEPTEQAKTKQVAPPDVSKVLADIDAALQSAKESRWTYKFKAQPKGVCQC